MSLTGKQIRELNYAYKSVYAKQEPVVENLAITEEQFEELCITILAEAFESYGMEVYDQSDLQEVVDPKAPVKQIAKEIIKQGIKKTIKTLKYPAIFGLGADTATGGKGSRTVLGLINNAIPIARDMYTAVKGNKEFAGTVLKDKEKGTFSTAEQDRKRTKKESVQFALHIVEDESIKDLIDKKNKKDKTDSNKDTNVINKDNKEINKDQKTDKEKVSLGSSGLKDTSIGKIGFQGTEAEFNKKYGIEPEKSNDNIKKDDSKKNEVKPETNDTKKDDTKNNEVKPPEDDKKNEVKPPETNEVKPPEKKIDFKSIEKYSKPKEVTMKDFETPKDDKKKKKEKPLLSTHIPIVSKTKLGSTVRPVKPGSARDKMIARNEVIHGSDKIVKKREMNADFQRMKKGEITKTDFIKQYPGSQTAKKYKLDMIKRGKKFENYEPYHIVLGYLLHEGHADTINEAHYVMTQMDDETVQEIVALDEGPIATAGAVAGALTLGGMGLNAIRKQLDNKKKMEKGGTFKQGSMMDNIQKKKNMLKNLENY